MKRYRAIVDGLCLEIYKSANLEDEKLAVYLYGFPGSSGKTEPVEQLIKAGFTVIQPHYRGSYDSSGEFSPDSSMNLLKEIERAISRGEVTEVKKGEKISVPKAINTVLGHSFGSFAALKGTIQLNSLNKLILMGPLLKFSLASNGVGLNENGKDHYEYVKRSRPHTYRLSYWDEWKMLYDGRHDDIFGPTPNHLDEVVVIVGENDAYFDLNLLKTNAEAIVRNTIKGEFKFSFNIIESASHGPSGLFTTKVLAML